MTSMPLAVLGLVPRTSDATLTDAPRNAVYLAQKSERFPS